jgi:hypothetical protein
MDRQHDFRIFENSVHIILKGDSLCETKKMKGGNTHEKREERVIP